MRTPYIRMQLWTTHMLLQFPLVFSSYSQSPAALAVTAVTVPANNPQMKKLGGESSHNPVKPLQNKARTYYDMYGADLKK